MINNEVKFTPLKEYLKKFQDRQMFVGLVVFTITIIGRNFKTPYKNVNIRTKLV